MLSECQDSREIQQGATMSDNSLPENLVRPPKPMLGPDIVRALREGFATFPSAAISILESSALRE